MFRKTIKKPALNKNGHLPTTKWFIKLVDTPACLVLFHEKWGLSAYAPMRTEVIHRWNIKTVLRRAGVR